MPRTCHFLGTKTRSGNKHTIRGKAKYLGGIGLKTTSITKRTFKPAGCARGHRWQARSHQGERQGDPHGARHQAGEPQPHLDRQAEGLEGLSRPSSQTAILGCFGEPPVKGCKPHFSAKLW